MKDHQLVVNVEDFRAVKKAELILDGITVVAGENGCGKSTLSKLLYYLFKTANEYEFYLVDNVQRDLQSQIFLIRELLMDVKQYNKLSYRTFSTLEELKNHFTAQLNFLKKAYNNNSTLRVQIAAKTERLLNIHNAEKDIHSQNEVTIPYELIIEIETTIKHALDKAVELSAERPAKIVDEVLIEFFSDSNLPKWIQLLEYGYSIYGTNKANISQIHSVNSVVYIDSPMAVGHEKSQDNEHWNDLNNLLKRKKGQSGNGNIAIIQSQILDGDIVIDNDIANRFIYKRSDGKEFDLLSCATGVKSFAILQLLYKNGHLNDKTLLIIDEPEVHLHPQWIVEYARLMVLLNKELGVKFFVASHNPDMVSAIKYIAEREQTDANLNFYLAEKEADEFT